MQSKDTNHSLKAAVWYTFSNFISKALLYLCTPFYTRILSKTEYGQYSNFISWQSILTALFTLDLSSSVAIAYFEYKNKKKFDCFISSISIGSIIIPMFFCGIILIFPYELLEALNMQRDHLLLLLLVLCFGNTLGIFQAEQRTKIKYKLSSVLTLFASCGSVVLTIILASSIKDKLMGVLLGNILINIVINICLLFVILKRSFICKWEYIKFSLCIAIPLVPHVLAGTILGSSDKIMINRMCGSEKTALYNLVYTVSMIITMFASSINKAWVPWFFEKMSIGDDKAIKAAVRKIFPVMSFLAFGVCLISPEIVLILGGKQYYESIFLMPPLILQCICNFVSTFYINIEFFEKKTFGISVATVTSAVINILLNYYCIAIWGFKATAYTTLFSAILSLAFHLYKVKRQRLFYVFDNKFIMIMLTLTICICLFIQFTYKQFILRYILIVVYVTVIIIQVYHKRDEIQSIISNIFAK